MTMAWHEIDGKKLCISNNDHILGKRVGMEINECVDWNGNWRVGGGGIEEGGCAW